MASAGYTEDDLDTVAAFVEQNGLLLTEQSRSAATNFYLATRSEVIGNAMLRVAQGGSWAGGYARVAGRDLERLFLNVYDRLRTERWRKLADLYFEFVTLRGRRGKRMADSKWERRLLLVWQMEWLKHTGWLDDSVELAFRSYLESEYAAGVRVRDIRIVMPWEVGLDVPPPPQPTTLHSEYRDCHYTED